MILALALSKLWFVAATIAIVELIVAQSGAHNRAANRQEAEGMNIPLSPSLSLSLVRFNEVAIN